jgi:hypothetical protein
MSTTMKIFLALALSWSGFNVIAQELTEPTRIVGGRPVSLQPLFHWWTNTTAIMASNSTRTVEEQIPVPDRPLKHWVRLVTAHVTNNGFANFADVEIQHVPNGPVSRHTVVLQHGPFEEKKRVDAAAQEYANLGPARNAELERAETYAARAQAQQDRARLYHEIFAAGGSHVHARLADDYYAAAARSRRQANLARERAENMISRLHHLEKITGGDAAFIVDNFAMATGEMYRALPVYSLGLRFGR